VLSPHRNLLQSHLVVVAVPQSRQTERVLQACFQNHRHLVVVAVPQSRQTEQVLQACFQNHRHLVVVAVPQNHPTEQLLQACFQNHRHHQRMPLVQECHQRGAHQMSCSPEAAVEYFQMKTQEQVPAPHQMRLRRALIQMLAQPELSRMVLESN
jgi:hypothetical protein